MGADQWLKLDAQFMGKPFPVKLAQHFGLAGVATWFALLAACKRNPIQGRISFGTETEAKQLLFFTADMPLTNDKGEEWTLEEFFTYTRRHHQTRRTTRGRVKNEHITDWERWQNERKTNEKRIKDAERKRRSRARSHTPENETEREKENEDNGVTQVTQENPPNPAVIAELRQALKSQP